MNGPKGSGTRSADKAGGKPPVARASNSRQATDDRPLAVPSKIEIAAPPPASVSEMIEAAASAVIAPAAFVPPGTFSSPETLSPPEPMAMAALPDALPFIAPAPLEPVSLAVAEVAPGESDVVSQATSVAAMPPPPATTEGHLDMATTFDSASTVPAAAATQKVQAMFGGLNDRAKTAMEKGAKMTEELTELTKGNVEAIVASGKVVAKGAESMTQEAAEYGKKSFESTTAMFKSLAAVKSPTELFQIQSEFAKTSFDSAVAEASKLSEAWVKLAGEMVQPISNRYAVAAEKLKAAAL